MRRKRRQKRHLYIFICLLLILAIATGGIFLKIKPLLFTYAKSYAETLFLNETNIAIVKILNDNGISYSDIASLSRNDDGAVTSLEINIEKINLFKGLISNEISKALMKKEYYDLRIPLGTLLGSEFTTGIGPRIKFPMQATCTVLVDFKSLFYAAGINQVLHRILINIEIFGNILMIGCTDGFSVKTSAIAAETVIVGITPDAFTNVIEGANGSVVGDIFDYGYVDGYDSNGE